jgi:uncharacterized protein YndB with AHSA1/START domain
MTTTGTAITVKASVNAPLFIVWEVWTGAEHIINWNSASDDWQTTNAVNELKEGGRFTYRMEAIDGSMGFDFSGVYNEVVPFTRIVYTMDDGRKAVITFNREGEYTQITETFDPEQVNSADLQRTGWQAILDRFKLYTESFRESAKLRFETFINAPAEKVSKLMLAGDTYREWTKVFNPTSAFTGDWSKGSKILFTGTDEQGNVGGMVSRIAEHKPGRYLSIEHLGILHEGKEITEGSEVLPWAGSKENYTWQPEGGSTRLLVDLDSVKDHRNYFEETWPGALQILKEICERP